ncbi:hypothetical protein [Ilumatobacter sp.]|uniref:hypothetical protein n=1 Tax=Ilumatobacter sp. TaxID=1967498 RepID=UPI003B530547
MASDNTILRSMHDLGAAGWFGSVLMAAVATNRAAGDVASATESADRSGSDVTSFDDVGRVTNGVWERWNPVNAGLIAMHLVGATGLVVANKGRLMSQRGVGASSTAKTVVTAAALGASAYAGILGKRIHGAGVVPMRDGTTPTETTPDDVASALRQQNVLQWVIPALTGSIIVLGAVQGEQQRVSRVVSGTLDRLNPVR